MWAWVILPPALLVTACAGQRGRIELWAILVATSVLFAGATLGVLDKDQVFAPPWLWRLGFFVVAPWFGPRYLGLRTLRVTAAFWASLILQVFADVPMAELGAAIVLVLSNSPRKSFYYLPSLAICALLRYATCEREFFYAAYILHHMWILVSVYFPTVNY